MNLLRSILFVLFVLKTSSFRVRISPRIQLRKLHCVSMSTEKATPENKGAYTILGETAKALVSGTAGAVLMSHSTTWKPMYYIFMAVMNAILSKVLKGILKIPRPPGSKEDGYGMPSSHTQSLSYFCSILITGLLLNGKVTTFRIVTVASIVIYSILASSWRVKSGLHTINQTLVGGTIGYLFGQLSIVLEKYIIYQKHVDYTSTPYVLKRLTSGNVPFLLRLSVFSLGGFVLYKRELFDIEKRLHRSRQKKSIE